MARKTDRSSGLGTAYSLPSQNFTFQWFVRFRFPLQQRHCLGFSPNSLHLLISYVTQFSNRLPIYVIKTDLSRISRDSSPPSLSLEPAEGRRSNLTGLWSLFRACLPGNARTAGNINLNITIGLTKSENVLIICAGWFLS